ncbi:hypothetical protein ABGT16_05350 [Pseudomonas asiatica]|uniref:hypothetical protein n=1 Tax=Pseudomonas asiatica TaxID=2219225 RepID=UPI00345CDE07
MNRQAKINLLAFAVVWLLAVGVGIFQAWPAEHLQQQTLPKLPAFEECPSDFEDCFARALRARMNLVVEQLEFTEGYAGRVRNNLLTGAGVFLLPFALAWLWRDRRAVGNKIRKLFV